MNVLCYLCVGVQHENLGRFHTAILTYNEGKKFSEKKLGTTDQLYLRCCRAIQGARTKSKFVSLEISHEIKNAMALVPENQPIKGIQSKKVKKSKTISENN